jgi:hypothetical protein
LHVDGDKHGKPDFERQCKEKLPQIIPAVLSLRIIRWKKRPRGQELHNRLILTDIGGVTFGHGLDESNDHESDDQISRLDEESYLNWWKKYASHTSAFDRESSLVIAGQEHAK